MDTNPEAEAKKQERPSGRENPPTAESTTPVVQAPPERLSEKRRREEEDEDELVKLTSTPKRRSSSSGSGGTGLLRGKRSMSVGTTDKGTSQSLLGSMTGSAAPKRIAINLGSPKSSPTDTSPDTSPTAESGEKGSHEDHQSEDG